MFLKFTLTIAFFLIVSKTNGQTNNIVFDLADLTVDFESDFGWVSLEAFKSSTNDLLLEKNEPSKFGQLNWLSIGFPTLVLSQANATAPKTLFVFRPEGFYAKCDMLTDTHRSLFQGVVYRKYGINVTKNQIVSLVPAKLECSINFYYKNINYLINGKVTQLGITPLKIDFSAPVGSKERTAFEQRMNEDGNNLDVEIKCDIYSQGKSYRQNTLVITGNQMVQLGITDNLFGPASETFVTRTQISDLTTEIYQKLNIIEDYQMAQSEFAANFIDYFVQQTASQVFSKVNLSAALRGLSQYDFQADLQPSIITQELSKIFTINSTKGRELLVLNQSYYENLKTNSHIATKASARGSYMDIFSASASASYVKEASSDWTVQNSSFDYQLRELNQFSSNNIEWARSGKMIVPKSIQVAKLVKSLMQKNMVFTRVKREYYDAPFQRTVSLNTLGAANLPSNYVENSIRLANTEKQYQELMGLMSRQYEAMSFQQNETLNSLNKYSSSNNQKNQDLDLRISNLARSIESVSSNLVSYQNSLDKLHVAKGSWIITGKVSQNNYNDFHSKSANFDVNFKIKPQVFYTIKTFIIGDNRAALWSMENENISKSSVSVDIRFHGVFWAHNFHIEWVAIGVI